MYVRTLGQSRDNQKKRLTIFHEYGAPSHARFACAGALLSINLSLRKILMRTSSLKPPWTPVPGKHTPSEVLSSNGWISYLLSWRPVALTLERCRYRACSQKRTIQDVNKHLRPIALTPILFKIAIDYVVHDFVMPAVLKKIDGFQLNYRKKQIAQH